MTAEVLRIVAQLLAAAAGPFKYQYLLLWLQTLRRIIPELIVDPVDWSRLDCDEINPLLRRMLVALPQRWRAP